MKNERNRTFQNRRTMAGGLVDNPTQGVINAGMEDQMDVFGYKRSKAGCLLLYISVILSLGIARLVLHWYMHWRLYLSHVRCALDEADTLLLVENFQGKYKQYYVEDVKTIKKESSSESDFSLGRDNITFNHESVDQGVNQSVDQSGDQSVDQSVDQSGSIDSNQETYEQGPIRVHLSNNTFRDVMSLRAIWVKKLLYVWDVGSSSFLKVCGLDKGFVADDYHKSAGLSAQEQAVRRLVYGLNEINVPVESIPSMIINEVLNPFYIFQAFSVILWLIDGYVYYPVAIVVMTTFGISSYVIQTRKSQKMLHDTVHTSGMVNIWRGGDVFQEIPFENLVPGDVVVIPPQGCEMHCDVLLLSGQCIVNESMLTGESVPVGKTALPLYHETNHSPHTLFCGTQVLQARSRGSEQVKAVVLRTGFLTAKGKLVRSILYPPPADYQFESDSYKFIWILVVVAMMGLIYTVIAKAYRGIEVGELVVKALDLLTICIPPALPAAMTVGKLFAQKRLEKALIYCINSRVINVSGTLDCLCFDKTGTLTENGLDFCCGLPVTGNIFESPMKIPLDPRISSLLTKAMAVSHSLTKIDGELSGDPLDSKMFDATGWIFEDSLSRTNVTNNPGIQSVVYEPTNLANVLDKVKNSGDDNLQVIELYHQFTFDSTLQRMSVITRESQSTQYVLYAKGSPEMIKSLSNPDTVPSDVNEVLREYTEKGFRVLALGRRLLEDNMHYTEIQKRDREDLEKELDFLGMIVMENKLKAETAPVIAVLKNANIKTVMITGDNMETAISVARECGIVSEDEKVIVVSAERQCSETESQLLYTHAAISTTTGLANNIEKQLLYASVDVGYRFAMDGTTWKLIRENYPNLLSRFATRGAVFARMSSEQKQQLVLELKEIGHCVGMCGDGANDCGALRAAHVGISLSDAEASVASPFTSKVDNISCVPLVLREGRAALTTAFGIFKYMVLYSLMEFSSVVILYGIDSNMADLQFLFIDILLILQFAITFGRTEAFAGDLVKEAPMKSLLATIPITSVAIQVLIMNCIQLTAYFTIQLFPWFVPFEYSPDSDDLISYENYAIFASSMGQYLIMVFVFSKGAPYRKPIYTNYLLSFPLVLMLVLITYMTVYPAEWITNALEYMLPPTYDFRLIVLSLWLINFILSYFAEEVIIEYLLAKIIMPRWKNGKKSPVGHLNIEIELQRDSNWPQIDKPQLT